MGISIEAENAVQQSAARAAVSRKKQDAGYSLEISSIHRRSVHELMFAHISSHVGRCRFAPDCSVNMMQSSSSCMEAMTKGCESVQV